MSLAPSTAYFLGDSESVTLPLSDGRIAIGSHVDGPIGEKGSAVRLRLFNPDTAKVCWSRNLDNAYVCALCLAESRVDGEQALFASRDDGFCFWYLSGDKKDDDEPTKISLSSLRTAPRLLTQSNSDWVLALSPNLCPQIYCWRANKKTFYIGRCSKDSSNCLLHEDLFIFANCKDITFCNLIERKSESIDCKSIIEILRLHDSTLLSAHEDNSIRTWSLPEKKQMGCWQSDSAIKCLVGLDHDRIASGHVDGRIMIWDAHGSKERSVGKEGIQHLARLGSDLFFYKYENGKGHLGLWCIEDDRVLQLKEPKFLKSLQTSSSGELLALVSWPRLLLRFSPDFSQQVLQSPALSHLWIPLGEALPNSAGLPVLTVDK